ncbi:MAG: ribosome maturation factor RimM [Burkholderiaceae bacterium]|nr:ribosome maturation factor RimM [Burkholderiaceae bacterium]
MSVPSDLVSVGYISGAYGLNGWIRIRPYSSDADALLHAKTWWLGQPERPQQLREVDLLQAKSHSGDVVAQLVGVVERDGAEALKGSTVQISRRYFPPLADGEFYWVDLIGLEVENLRGERLGLVHDLMDNGAHPILRVLGAAGQEMSGQPEQEMLIPFVDHYVKTVDREAKKIVVDWELDY